MKQIDIIKTYGQKRCLVVDDVPDIRASLKRILIDFGSVNVDTAGNAEEAIDICQRNQYDIVLSDYNLGSSKNGQQLLEELRFHGLLKNTALYIMITAESASQYVLHALEYQPDDYLNKPISRDSLRPRLDQALLKNEALLQAKKSLDQKNPNAAIKACENLLAKKSRYSNDARKMLGELMISQKQHEQALTVYAQLPQDRMPIWANLGIARCYFGQKKFEKAEALLTKLIDENPLCVEAHDLLAKLFEAQNNSARAQQSLHNALGISPLSSDRQREMGRVSHEAGDELASIHAYRTALKQSRNSCHEQAEDYLYLAQGLTNLVRDDANETQKLSNEAIETLRSVEKRFGKQPIVNMRGKLVEADLLRVQKKEQRSQAMTEKALAVQKEMRLSAIQNTPAQLSIDCARAFMELGEYDAGDLLLQEVAKANNDPDIAIQLDKLLREPLTKAGVQHAAKSNKQGIAFYQQKEYEQAVVAFQNVLKELPNHIGLNLNLIQALISKTKGSVIDNSEVEIIADSLQRIGKIESDSSYAQRYEYLIRQYKNIIDRSTT
ncbi:tetratricopeptide repeat-containing response regulator [Teredinibacter franksiae]|uniref:tetratricopeptide repeat-containing response regulator n=1 Tax=Teredinibacter franksiae TaxID=2761453 RepID=UPI001623C6CF|nr:tetratricopeptide repeat-containing response regulator [Teredinibacter franksiae]